MAGWQRVETIFDEDARWGPPLSSASPAPSDAVAPVTPTRTTTDEAKSAAEFEPERRFGYLRRHWRGDLGLGISYWVNCVLLSIMLSLLGLGIGHGIGVLRVPPTALAVAISMMVPLGMVITLWQSVGTWRSAGRHIPLGGRRVWSLAAKILVVAGLVRSVAVLGTQEIPTALIEPAPVFLRNPPAVPR
jgi:hypothetical protein